MASDASQLSSWRIDPPDADGFVWQHWDEGTGQHSLNLGKRDDVREKFSQWLAMVETEDGY